MTAYLLAILGHVRGGLGSQLLMALLVLGLLPITLSVDLLRWAVRRLVVHLVLRQRETVCQRGHPLVVWGTYTCRCGFTYHGSGFSPCPACRDVADWIVCPCGSPAINPLGRTWR